MTAIGAKLWIPMVALCDANWAVISDLFPRKVEGSPNKVIPFRYLFSYFDGKGQARR